MCSLYFGNKGAGISKSDLEFGTNSKYFPTINEALDYGKEFLESAKLKEEKK